jgi:hypothetical protein
LGAATVLTAKQYIVNSLHVVTGASVLVTSLVLALRAHRARFAASRREALTTTVSDRARTAHGNANAGARA